MGLIRKAAHTLMSCLTLAAFAFGSGQAAERAAERVRHSVLAGAWYPADPAELAILADGYLAEASTIELTLKHPIRALILPHAGYRYSGQIAGMGAGLLRGSPYRRVVVLAPTHYSPFRGLSIADVDYYATPLGKVPVDGAAVDRLRISPLVTTDPQAHVREHSIEIQLPLLQQVLPAGWQLIPVLVGQLSGQGYTEAATLLRPLLNDETLLVVSSDFTHYGASFQYQPFPIDRRTSNRIKQLDEGALQHILHKNTEAFLAYRQRTGITVCGFRPIALLLELLNDDALLKQVAYATSADLSGDHRESVSYAALVTTAPRPLAAR